MSFKISNNKFYIEDEDITKNELYTFIIAN